MSCGNLFLVAEVERRKRLELFFGIHGLAVRYRAAARRQVRIANGGVFVNGRLAEFLKLEKPRTGIESVDDPEAALQYQSSSQSAQVVGLVAHPAG